MIFQFSLIKSLIHKIKKHKNFYSFAEVFDKISDPYNTTTQKF